jgi:ADP-ribosylglycohydrolase
VCYEKVFVDGPGEKPGGEFSLESGQWTDDTSMGLCLCDSLLVNKGRVNNHDLMQRFLAWWYMGYNNGQRFDEYSPKYSNGLGGNVSMSFDCYLRGLSPDGITGAGDTETSGNGTVMRLGGIPVCYWDNLGLAQEAAERQSKITHKGHEAAECCRLLAFLMVNLINGRDAKDALKNLGNEFTSNIKSVQCLARSQMEGNDINRDWNWKKANFRYSPQRSKENPGYIGSYAMDATAMALHCLWSTNSAKEAILKAVNLRGDADSVGSVAGQIAGAAYGFSAFPDDWIAAINKWDNYEIGLRAYKLYHKNWA